MLPELSAFVSGGMPSVPMATQPRRKPPAQKTQNERSDTKGKRERLEQMATNYRPLAIDYGSITNQPKSGRRIFSCTQNLSTKRPTIGAERKQGRDHEHVEDYEHHLHSLWQRFWI